MGMKYLQLDNKHFSQKWMYLLQKQICNNYNHQQPALNNQMIINDLFIKCVRLHRIAVMVIDVMKDIYEWTRFGELQLSDTFAGYEIGHVWPILNITDTFCGE